MDGFKNSTRMKYMDEGVSTRPTTASGRRMTNEELGMTPGGVEPTKKKKAMPKGMGQMADREMQMLKAAAKKPIPKPLAGAAAGAAAGALAGAGARAAGKAMPRGVGAMSNRDMQMAREAMKKAVPAHSSKPLIRRKTGGLTAMPKGKC